MFEVIITGIIAGVVSAGCVIAYSRHLQYKRMSKMYNYAQDILQEFEERVINARLEIEDGVIRCYNKDTDEFLAQGRSMDEVNDVLKKRFPDKLFNVRQEQIDRATNLRG